MNGARLRNRTLSTRLPIKPARSRLRPERQEFLEQLAKPVGPALPIRLAKPSRAGAFDHLPRLVGNPHLCQATAHTKKGNEKK